MAGAVEHERVIKNSVFRAYAAPIRDAEEALAFIKAHAVPDASHNCWAFKAGDVFRTHDAGEPGGTAGRPILAAIEGQCMDGVCVLVARWFGGVKLGAGGLVRAYGGTASACLHEAPKVPLIARTPCRFHCPFTHLAQVQAHLGSQGVDALQCDYGADGADFILAVPDSALDNLSVWLRDLTRGQHALHPLNE
ncbi:DUF1949 domain-containing protein [Formicincola oecophyllae]|uniref:DUF1949 domain-containing protein n=1 Tax=Formicincola oecophyllae TaxID=2558361 RepID=A0A4Y6UD56_9PROT|nr:YigZ family protein [Formicincola oecophyllae]QDH14377.1 DUF1949 domain-containing protein [Formicincola oecophyllae]